MKSQDEFKAFYRTELNKAASFLEDYRLQGRRSMRIMLMISLALTLLIIWSLSTNHGVIIFFAALPSLSLLSSVYRKYVNMNKYLKYRYKKHVLQRAIGFYFDDFEYISRQKIAKVILIESKLFHKNVDRIYGEDFMRFTIGKVKMMFCETQVYRNQDLHIFDGIFITSSFNKYFKSETFVIARKSSTILKRVKKLMLNDIHEVNLENPKFEEKFQTLANNQTEARYILTPIMMERMLEYGNKIGKDMSISFVKNRMYCSIPYIKDLFEPSISKPIDFAYVEKSIEPVLLFTDIVEDLVLNLRIWSKK